jgi:SAM-dependent methyltransferase
VNARDVVGHAPTLLVYNVCTTTRRQREHDMTADQRERWVAGERYEPYVGRWSRLVAREFLAWLAVPPDQDWLDVGCGTGALTETILRQARPRSVTGIDASPTFVQYARAHIVDARATFATGDARTLPVMDAQVDAAVCGLVLNFVPQPETALADMRRAVRPSGVVAAYVWDYAGQMEMMRYFWDAAVALDHAAAAQDEGRRFGVCRSDALSALWTGAGLEDVQVRPIVVPTRFKNFDDYWTPFLGGQGTAPTYAMSLSEAARGELRDRIRAELPVGQDGAIELQARAWAVRGRT